MVIIKDTRMTKKYLLIALVMFEGFWANAETADHARSSQFAVPILTGDYADPSIVKVEGTYYMTHSSFRYAPGLLIWKSTDLQNWTPVTYALQQYHGDVWAPDLVHHKGKFYNGIYVGGYSTHTFGGFLALRLAIYCSGEGRAIFRAFKVVPLR